MKSSQNGTIMSGVKTKQLYFLYSEQKQGLSYGNVLLPVEKSTKYEKNDQNFNLPKRFKTKTQPFKILYSSPKSGNSNDESSCIYM